MTGSRRNMLVLESADTLLLRRGILAAKTGRVGARLELMVALSETATTLIALAERHALSEDEVLRTRAISTDSPRVRLAALGHLHSRGDADDALLLRASEDEDAAIRLFAAERLLGAGLPTLRNLTLDEEVPTKVRTRALHALTKNDDPTQLAHWFIEPDMSHRLQPLAFKATAEVIRCLAAHDVNAVVDWLPHAFATADGHRAKQILHATMREGALGPVAIRAALDTDNLPALLAAAQFTAKYGGEADQLEQLRTVLNTQERMARAIKAASEEWALRHQIRSAAAFAINELGRRIGVTGGLAVVDSGGEVSPVADGKLSEPAAKP